MRVFLLGATGNLGSRLVPALLDRQHNVVAYVRSSSKLQHLLPTEVHRKISVVQGDATDSQAISRAIIDSKCEAVVSTAGVAAMAPWGQSDLPKIFRAVLDAATEVGAGRQCPLRVWFLGGLGVLHYPGTDIMLSNYIPIFLEHRQNIQLLRSLPSNTVNWSMLCPATMTPESADLSTTTRPYRPPLAAAAGSPPLWQKSWLSYIPLIGRPLVAAMNASRYETTLEQNAEFIAGDLEDYDSRWIGKTVGVIDASR